LWFVKSLLGICLHKHNQLLLRNSSTLIINCKNPIRHHTFRCEFWLEELDSMMCSDAHACDQLCKQFWKALGSTYQLTNYKHDYSNNNDYGLLLDTDVVRAVVLSHSTVYGFKFSNVSSFFDLWSLSDTLSRIYPYKLNGTYFMNASCTFLVPWTLVLNFNLISKLGECWRY
jgi:hypothetical protein